MALQHFIVGRDYLGSRQIPDTRIVPGLEVRWHHSYAFFCMRCGEIWARVMHEGSPLTQCRNVCCRKHGDGRLSDMVEWSDSPLRPEPDWPAAALKWELESALALADSGGAKTGLDYWNANARTDPSA